MPHYTLGISAFYHDSAAALVKDSIPVAAAQEERFTRIKSDPSFPKNAVEYCLNHEGITLDDVSSIVYYEDANAKYERVLGSFASSGLGGIFAFSKIFPEWKSWKKDILKLVHEKLSSMGRGTPRMPTAVSHHKSHAAAAFYPSMFDRATVLCIDSVGEWHSTSIWCGDGNDLTLKNSISYPHSLGLLYSAFTYYCGFKVDSGEYKMMGLSPYGSPKYYNKILDNIINIFDDSSFALNLDYFDFLKGRHMISRKFEDLFEVSAREPETEINQFYCDIAASIQKVTQDVILGLAKRAVETTGVRNLCLAGGVALNCVANGALSRSGLFEKIWVPPAPGDAGSALGAALEKAVKQTGRPHLPTKRDAMNGALLGPMFSNEQIKKILESHDCEYELLDEEVVYQEVASFIAQGKVVGWFQGRMEFGPRALGSRSILADPRNTEMQSKLNLKIKYRESFRPFAPSILIEDAKEYFDISEQSSFMGFVSNVKETHIIRGKSTSFAQSRGLNLIKDIRSSLPAVTHIDYSARVQTVSKHDNEKFWKLLHAFKKLTGCPLLINTSFNVRGEPIVCTPKDAYDCFKRTEMDVLVMGNYIIKKKPQQEIVPEQDWRSAIPLD